MTDLVGPGGHCPTAGSLVPLYDGQCDWCGQEHPATYGWDPVAAQWVETDTPPL